MKFVKFVEDISVDGNEYLGESILEAYGLCFFDVSLRNEANKILEAVGDTKNKVLQEGVLETMRTWPRQKIMALVLGALITMTASKGMAANSQQVIDGARASVIEQLGGDDNDGDDEAVDKMVKGAVKKYGDKIEEKAAEKAGDMKDVSHSQSDVDNAAGTYIDEHLKTQSSDEIRTTMQGILDKGNLSEGGERLAKTVINILEGNTAKIYIDEHLKTQSTEEIKTMMQGILKKGNISEEGERLAKTVIKLLDSGYESSAYNEDAKSNRLNSGDHSSNRDKAYRELEQNGKLRDAGMSDEDISKYRFGNKKNMKSYSYGGAMVTSQNAPDEAEMERLSEQVKKILSKS